ncbi:MAG: aldehyde-activating protein [Pseudomonadales bacterium]|nr:aldehyde-activating protein [Pseudomonadales bacterium]
MAAKVSGGCLCGEIRFETTSEPALQVLCHCTDCQTVSGASAYSAYVVPTNALTILQGNPTSYEVRADSGRTNRRRFCPNCGSRVWAELDEMGFMSVNGLALDDRKHFQPAANLRLDSAPSWCQIDTTLETMAG